VRDEHVDRTRVEAERREPRPRLVGGQLNREP
jgi:hypothetical protein